MTLHFSEALGLLEIIVASLVAAVIFSPLAIWIAKRVGLLDIPGAASHKQHARPTPLAGGIAMALSVLVLITIFGMWQTQFARLLAAALIIFIFGLWDDARGLSAPQKFLGQVLASIVLISSGISVKFLSGLSISFISPILLTLLNWLITIIWLVGISNSINLIDSMDGLALGVTAIIFGFLLALSLVAQQPELAAFCGIFLGICIGLFAFNISPAHLFLGDSGTQTLGFILGTVALIYTPNEFPQASSWFLPILMLGVPIFDTTLVVTTRIVNHKPIFQADRSHIYHRLVNYGLGPGRAVLVVHIATLTMNFLAFFALYLIPWQSNLIFGLTVAAGLGLLVFLIRKDSIGANVHG